MTAGVAAILLAAAVGHAALAPAPAPIAPPTNPGPGPSLPSTHLSPLLLGPGAAPPEAGSPAAGPGASIDQQKLHSYRNDLLDQQRSLDRAGVSPADPRYRDLEQQLLRLNNSE